MKLPDFRKSIILNRLRELMDAPLIELETKSGEWGSLDFNMQGFIDGQFDIVVEDIENIEIGTDGTYEYHGKKILVYIRDQYVGHPEDDPSNKFHMTQCKTLDQMEARGRFHTRYVMTRRKDGLFKVNKLYYGKIIEKDLKVPLYVCKNCLFKMRYKGYPRLKDKIYNEFNIEEYFKEHDSTITSYPTHNEDTMPENVYSKRQKELSYIFRTNRNWRCEKCHTDFSRKREFLHLHHIDGNKRNNIRSNLFVLCLVCHSNIASHSHLKRNPDWGACMDYIKMPIDRI